MFWRVVFNHLSFLFIPRLEAGIFGHDVGNLTRTGITTTVSLKGGQSIEVSYTPVMSVYIPTAGQHHRYKKATVLAYYKFTHISRNSMAKMAS
jgi:hypothetical protein